LPVPKQHCQQRNDHQQDCEAGIACAHSVS
jgi:hypothetical protein